MTDIHSSQDFIRALKAPADPPTREGSLKIDIARQAWDNGSFYLPNKAEVIVEWILQTLAKTKAQSVSIFNQQYWDLLLHILSDKNSQNKNTRPLKTWLTPLLHRISLQPTLSTFLAHFKDCDAHISLSETLASAVAIMWPISVQKMTLESLAELFGILLQRSKEETLPLGIVKIGFLVISSYRISLGNSVNKKKSYQLFLQTFLPTWLHVLMRLSNESTPAYMRFSQNVYDVGGDSFFNLDTLRQLSDSRPQEQSTALFDHLHALRSSQASSVLNLIPKIFLSYVQAMKKHRGAVFSHTSSGTILNDELNVAGMRFYTNCEKVLVGMDENKGDSVEIWNARLALLSTVLDEKLFTIQQEEAAEVLKGTTATAINVLSESWQESAQQIIFVAVKCLHKIGQIDCDLLLPSIPQILPAILPLPMTDPAPALFLNLILEYHTKTRTLDTHITNFLSSLSPTSFPSSTDTHDAYIKCFSGHILSTNHLEKLGNAVRRFLTPGQTSKVVENIINVLGSGWNVFFDASESKKDDENPKKKKRTNNDDQMDVDSPSDVISDTEILAVSLSMKAYLSLAVFSNLPIQSLTDESASSVRELITNFRDDIVRSPLGKALKTKRLGTKDGKRKRGRESASGWEMQIVAAALLKLEYNLHTVQSLALSDSENSGNVVERVMKVMTERSGGSLSAEFELEAFRTLLYYVSTHDKKEAAAKVIDLTLAHLTQNIQSADDKWSGLSCNLQSVESGGLALLHLILERWLPFIDHLASPSQLTSVVQLILKTGFVDTSTSSQHTLKPWDLLQRLLHSAEFWEMHNFRTAFLSHLVEVTGNSNSKSHVAEVAYQLLLYVPSEYFTKSSRAHFLGRAYALDIQLVKSFTDTKSKQQSQELISSTLKKLITLRVFLKRMIASAGVEKHTDIDLGDFAVHLISFDRPINAEEYEVFIQSTVELIGLFFSEFLRNSSYSDALLKLITTFSQYPIFTSANDVQGLQSKAIMKLLDLITKTNGPSSLPSECINVLRDFYNHLRNALHTPVQSLTATQLPECLKILSGWYCVLKLCKWLRESISENVGKHLVSLVGQVHPKETASPDKVRVIVFDLLGAELLLLSRPNEIHDHLDIMVAAYIMFSDASSTSRLDEQMSSVSKSLSPEAFSHVLNLLTESLDTLSTRPKALERILHLSILLLKDHPQHTLKHVQAFVIQCFNTFAGHEVFINGPVSLRLLTLELITQHCSERPAAIRSIDLGSLWAILFKFLEPSEERDDRTTPEIFHKITASISALVRLRRDLLTPVLPHLVMILRQLIFSIRSCRLQLGTKQATMVMRTQPRWISNRQPLGSEEGRMLARLLETLNTKTITRSHIGNETQKAESLARPFSKHAAYVLEAYIEVLNDPLCVLNIELRRELEPGLFALCALMGENARDALIVGLDTNGKAALKMIWREYDKQRYVGKG